MTVQVLRNRFREKKLKYIQTIRVHAEVARNINSAADVRIRLESKDFEKKTVKADMAVDMIKGLIYRPFYHALKYVNALI